MPIVQFRGSSIGSRDFTADIRSGRLTDNPDPDAHMIEAIGDFLSGTFGVTYDVIQRHGAMTGSAVTFRSGIASAPRLTAFWSADDAKPRTLADRWNEQDAVKRAAQL